MITLKFRAFSHVYKRMFEVTHIDFSSPLTGYVTFDGNEGDVWDAIFDGIDFTLMQCTGLTDRNHQEIYEGDIVSYTQHLFNTAKRIMERKEVKWITSIATFNVYETEAGQTGHEVVGNIYENPELV